MAYPSSLDSFIDPQATDTLEEVDHAGLHRALNTAVEAVEAELGITPRGAYATVADRLVALAAAIQALEDAPDPDPSAAIAAHNADTTAVHGIVDTANLILEGDARLSDARTPTGVAGGDLTGTFPNPTFAVDMATQAELNAVSSAKENTGVAAALVDDLSGVTNASQARTNLGLGTAATQSAGSFDAAGAATAAVAAHESDTTAVHGITDTANLVLTNDSRLADSRSPSGSAGGVLAGSYPSPSFAVDMATQAELDAVAAAKENAGTAASAVALHEADTSNVHGITDTTALVLTTDTRLTRIVQIQVSDPNGSVVTTGDGKAYFTVPAAFNGMNLVSAHAALTTVSSSGLPTVQIANVTDAVDILSTEITIDVGEFNSYTATTQPVINLANDNVATGDRISVDVDIAGTGAKGLQIILEFG